MSLIPFSPLATGHLSRKNWDSDTKRGQTDVVANHKYDRTKEHDIQIVSRVLEIADKYSTSMSEIALAWLYAKDVAAPIVGATKVSHFDQACNAINLKLSDGDIDYLEELYIPHFYGCSLTWHEPPHTIAISRKRDYRFP